MSRLDNEFNNAEPISREESDLTIQQRDAEVCQLYFCLLSLHTQSYFCDQILCRNLAT